MRRRCASVLFAGLLCFTFLGAPKADDDGPPLLRSWELGLNFGAGKASKKIYSDILIPDVRDAKMEFGAELAEDQFGLCIDGKKPNAFGFVTLKREFLTGDAGPFAAGRSLEVEGTGDRFRAQVLIEARLVEVSTNNVFGMERDAFNEAGELTDFVFVGFTPNAGINGLTAFANHNGTPVGSTINLPDTEVAGVLIDQDADRIRAYIRRLVDTEWTPIVEIVTPQPEVSFLGFGASNLQKKDTVYFRDFHAKGSVNGLFEQPILRDVTMARRKLNWALDALEQDVPDFSGADLRLGETLALLDGIESDIQAQQEQFQANTGVAAMLTSLDRGRDLIITGRSHVQANNAERARIPVLGSIPFLSNIFANGAGFNVKKAKERDLLILIRPTNILPLDDDDS